MALAAYRHLLRSARIAFEGDAPVLLAAQSQIRNSFIEKRTLDPSNSEATEAIEHANAVAKFLRENLIQGHKQEGQEHSYKLRIHEHTERGDNESIKTAGQGTATGGGCCGGSGKK